MKTLLLFFLVFSTTSFTQVSIFDNVDLENGDYTLLGIRRESDRHKLCDSLRDWYITDKLLLQEMAKTWRFSEEAPYYACGYHYQLMLCKNGKAISNCWINLYCKSIVIDDKSYAFDPNLLRALIGKTRITFGEYKSFELKKGREYVDSIQNMHKLIFAPEPDWLTFEGEFEFIYNIPAGVDKYYIEPDTPIDSSKFEFSEEGILLKLEKEIQLTYPNEKFKISSFGGSLTEVFVRITCNHSLEQKFDLYKREEYQEWNPFEASITVYWKR